MVTDPKSYNYYCEATSINSSGCKSGSNSLKNAYPDPALKKDSKVRNNGACANLLLKIE